MAPRTAAITGGLIVLVLGILAVVQLTWINGIWMAFRGYPVIWVLILALATTAAAIMAYESDGPFIPLALATTGLVFFAVFLFAYSGYAKAKIVNEQNQTMAAENGLALMPEHETRAPYLIAQQQTNDNITINGTAQNTTHIPALNKYGAPVVRKGWLKGYGQVVSQYIGQSGQSELEYCDFDSSAVARLGGIWSHNLERRIMRENFGILIDSVDSYAYCDEEGTPLVVVPFTEYKGFLFPVEVPAGVAVYNGATDELEVKRDVEIGEIPGPVYPISLAEQAREATKSVDGWWNYIQENVGFQEYGGENSGDYTLRRADGEGDSFVTPLTPIGAGKAITAVGYVESNGFEAGELNTYAIALLPESRQGDGAVADRVVNDYPELNWASGLKVFEITPTGPDKWTATIGLNKAVAYRLEIKPDASSCLFNLRGEQIRCGGSSATGAPTPDGEVPNLESMSAEELEAYFAGLSPEDFQAFLEAVDSERDRRLAAYPGASAE